VKPQGLEHHGADQQQRAPTKGIWKRTRPGQDEDGKHKEARDLAETRMKGPGRAIMEKGDADERHLHDDHEE
jgi:hypothetical protein